MAAKKLLNRVKELNYIVLECLAERTLAERYQAMASGGDGYDSNSMFMLLSIVLNSSLFMFYFWVFSKVFNFQFQNGCLCYYLWLWIGELV